MQIFDIQVLPEVWFMLNLIALLSGFGLLSAVAVLQRPAPARGTTEMLSVLFSFFLLAGVSFIGSYRGVVGRDPEPFTNFVLGLAVGVTLLAELRFVVRFRRRGGARRRMRTMVGLGAAAVVFWFAALAAGRAVQAASVMLNLVLVSFTFLCAHTAFELARRTPEAQWRPMFRGFATASAIVSGAYFLSWLLLTFVVPDLAIARSELVFVLGYIAGNIRLLAGLVRTFQEDLAARSHIKPSAAFGELYGLTPREREILERLFDGNTNAKIGHELCISVRTVDTHMVNIFKKCRVSSRYELFKLLRRHT